MSIQAQRARSILLCIDKEFKMRATTALLDSAVAGEKYQVEKLFEARDKFLEDDRIGIVIFNGDDYPLRDFFSILKVFEELYQTRKCYFIVYYGEDLKKEVITNKNNFPHCHFFEHPASKKDINSIINPIKSVSFQKKNLNEQFLEATLHLKETVEDLQQLINDRRDIERLYHIGQRFNGLIGAYSFFKTYAGYRELMEAATIIDEITRHYLPEKKREEITEPHFKLLLETAKLSYLMLKELRENRPLTTDQTKALAAIKEQYAAFTEIQRRSQMAQSEVDELLKAL
jgi:hypothetical protein